ncbi:hypothetical protein AVV36_gp113 [Pectobacterium bacteriophage PM2]|uniref:Uncharacterized protein n=1 Tax=Pectobacterium bacteriophage PM2 TaxID=1429794 RepID=A0A0A0Q2E9_9CAUD|nr:hypothetical protein AVV36_gp113 [Pectobacterium bacteriophage PM2]AHY25075.1 hypothetical protein PM2_113 [Pectobacterium bacteriophage PM2]
MKAQITDIVPGRILYHVYGVSGLNTEIDERNVTKIIVTSKPYGVNIGLSSPALFFKNITVYENYSGEISEYETSNSVNDCGIVTNDERSIYNLNRLFTSKESAMNFMRELQTGKFSDPVDQEYANSINYMSGINPNKFIIDEDYDYDYYDYDYYDYDE